MIAYVGQTRAAGLVRELAAAGIGECTTRGELPPRRPRWFYDCGAFSDFTNRRPFDAVRFSRDLVSIRRGGRGRHTFGRPDFIVIPDSVGDWPATVRQARSWAAECHEAGAPLYLAVQNDALGDHVAALGAELGIAGVFVGGSLEWKLATAGAWVQTAHAHGWQCHVGRVGTIDRVRWAREIGADSIDSCLPLWQAERLDEWRAALVELYPTQPRLFA